MRGTEFAELKAFAAVAEQGNFSRAAVLLGMAPSTLSQTIQSLEVRYGVRLLHRTTRSVSLTEAGAGLFARVRPLFEELDAAIESINDYREVPMGTLRLCVSTIAAHMILAPMLKRFLQAYPEIRLEITVDNAEVDLVKGRFDAGIRHGMRIAQDMQVVKASHPSRIIAMASPDYLARHPAPKTPQDLQHHACVILRHPNQAVRLWTFERNKRTVELEPHGPLIVTDLDLMIGAVRDGIGIGYMAESYMAADLASGRLVPLLSDWSTAYDSWYLYYAGRHHLPTPLRVLIACLRDYMDECAVASSSATGP